MFMILLIVQLTTFSYHQLTTRFDFYPFNGIRHYSAKERRNEALINGIVMAVPVMLTFARTPLWIGIGGLIWTLVLVGAILNWWLPYVSGVTVYKMPNNETWQQVYDRIFSKTIILLPSIKNNPRPNLEHIILHVLILSSAITAWMYVLGQP
ncbi:hypothetical protein BBD42_22950 [Paenibacillus sp. BIHB 4019]|uniref:Uncharacterized protein n=1 Tax=Paenibacillus sp. BIHB 4019 TaxID=1870819 RepID=A0A1B2DMT2_9BACL|nr:hypothetical protein [Paenibacillus sp. BIHB 4019]ANY69022.1 hypothetical protein BBD42_22950 [Paenibacillus sp. BIHB 4019]